MASFFSKKKLNRLVAKILNAKTTYIIIILIILAQFVLVSFIYLKYSQINQALSSITANISKISGQQNLLNEKLNSLQSSLGIMQSQLYRLQRPENIPE